jgi:benzoyl-CoA reductase/2-hydroxyglutaryl-CoA dehydratase subunit BcrC/BadD/HgdB
MIILLDVNATVGRENIFKPTSGNESLDQNSNDSGVRIIKFTTSKSLVVKSTMFTHRNTHTWTSPDWKTHNQIDHIVIDMRWHSSMLDLRSFRAADCDADHYLVAAKLRERLTVNKQAAQKLNVERFKIRKLNELELRKQYKIKISNRFAALENLSDSEDVNRVWENIQENIKTSVKESLGLYELKQHTPWFDEEHLGFFRSKETG